MRTGKVATYIPALAAADPEWFGIALVTTDGTTYEVGDSRQPFTIQSISKPFTYGLVLGDRGRDAVLGKIGVEPSGEAFNSINLAPETGCPRNPMINAGAIAAAALVAGHSPEDRLERVLATFSLHAGRRLGIDPAVYESERDTGHRNRAIGHLLRNFGVLTDDPEPALDLYFRQCSIRVDCRDLATMAATLANGGTNPRSGEVAVRREIVTDVLSVMTTCGMYDYAGEWLYWVGMPAKSGVAGGVLAVLPGQVGIGVFSPRLDERGNSVRGVQVCKHLAADFGTHFLATPRSASTGVRRQYDLASVSSKRHRVEAQRARLDQAGRRARVYDLAGDLAFSAIELAARRIVESEPDLDLAILDLTQVTRIEDSAVRILQDLLRGLDRDGKALLFVKAHRHPHFLRLLEEASSAGEQPAVVRNFADLDLALEWAEERLLGGARRDGQGAVPLAGHDICRRLDADEIERLRPLLVPRRYARGDVIIRRGDPPDALYLVMEGEVSVTVDLANGQHTRLATISAGMPFGELAVVDRSPRSADVRADTAVECLVLPIAALDRLSETMPSVKIKLLENLLTTASRKVVRLNDEVAALTA